MFKIIISLLLVGTILGNSHDCFSQLLTDQRANVVRLYKSQIGVRELTGHNDGVDVQKYLKSVGLGKGNPWCAAFVKWCLIGAKVQAATKINGMALSVYKKEGLIYQKRFYGEPLPGDAFTLYYASLKRIGHTGFFNGWANRGKGMYYTVEGNTSGGGSRDGDGVYLRIRSVGGTYAINRWFP